MSTNGGGAGVTPCPQKKIQSKLKHIKLQRRRGLLRKYIFLVQVQAAISGSQTFYWSSRTASHGLSNELSE